MIVGFTGTRKGMTYKQKETLASLLSRLAHNFYDDGYKPLFVHGACIGADEEAALIATNRGYATKARPSDMPELTTKFVSSFNMPSKPPLQRNRDIVAEAETLIACPKQVKEPSHDRAGGTWYTVRYAKTQRHLYGKVITIWPDGTQEVSCKLQ